MRPNVSKNNIQYPPQTGAYKVFVKDKRIWKDFSEARLQISVGNPKHTGDKFFALTEWAAARFDKVTLIVSDTLQRHNVALQHNISSDEAGRLALFEGQKWLKDNEAAIKNLSPSQCVVTRWNDWLSHPEYPLTRAEIDRLYRDNRLVSHAVNLKSDEFCSRQSLRSAFVGADDRALAYSAEFILEELAAFGIMLRQQPVVDVYPGSWFKEIFSVIAAESGQSPLLRGFEHAHYVGVDYVRNKAFSQETQPAAMSVKSVYGLS